MQIEYYRKAVYGVERIYIESEGAKEAIATLTRRKTVEREDIEALERLGADFKEIPAPSVV